VIGSASGTLFVETFRIPGFAGTGLLLAVIAFLAFKGTRLIEGVLSAWSFVLYAVYLGVFLLSVKVFGPMIREALATAPIEPGWLLTGFRYGVLQLALVPAMLFATTWFTCRRDALVAGALTGPILMIPAALFYFAMLGHYPEILQRPVPVNYLLGELGSPILVYAFPVVLIGTFIETGTGMIHAFNERLAGGFRSLGKALPTWARPAIAVGLLFVAVAPRHHRSDRRRLRRHDLGLHRRAGHSLADHWRLEGVQAGAGGARSSVTPRQLSGVRRRLLRGRL
jgi:uncharacterized membrane protein YkvI